MTCRALITGAGGFAGNALDAHLRASGWETLRCDLRAPEGIDGWLACDVSRADEADRLLAWAGPVTHVFHLAAVTFVPDSAHDPARTFEVNLLGTIHLTSAVRRHAPAARFVNVASSEVYGHPQFLPMTEEHPLNPANPYAISKAAADLYCACLHHAGELDVIRLRPFNHSGPGQSDRFVLSSFARQIARIEAGRLEPVLRVGNLDAARDFLHVKDVVRAYELAASRGVSGEAYNICSGAAVSVREALDRLLLLSKADIRIETDPNRVRPVDVLDSRGSHAKLTAQTGWQPQVPFDDLLTELLQYWRDRENQPR